MPRQRVTSEQPNSVVMLFPTDDLYSTFKHFISETVLFQMEIRKISDRRPRSVDDAELGHFTLLFCRGGQICIKIYNARAQLLVYLLNLMFGDVCIAVVVVVSLSSLMTSQSRRPPQYEQNRLCFCQFSVTEIFVQFEPS